MPKIKYRTQISSVKCRHYRYQNNLHIIILMSSERKIKILFFINIHYSKNVLRLQNQSFQLESKIFIKFAKCMLFFDLFLDKVSKVCRDHKHNRKCTMHLDTEWNSIAAHFCKGLHCRPSHTITTFKQFFSAKI